jgi:hypothetical protein
MGRLIVLGALASSLLVGPASASEVCVICTSPDTTYRCTLEGPTKIERIPAAEQVLEIVCARKLAKSGGHAKCRARRENTGTACVGPVKTISLAKIEKAVDKFLTESPKPRDSEGAKAAPKADPNAPPKTLEEMARRAKQGTQPSAKSAPGGPDPPPVPATPSGTAQDGAVGAPKQPWSCLTSWFKEC